MSDPESSALGRIGICLSGGGYRAAAFHLGVLDLLKRAGLLDDVLGLSTVSGGTFAGARWALGLAQGETFEAYYAALYKFLLETDCIHTALKSLGSVRGTPSHRQSLITAAAQVYATAGFMGPANFGTILDTPTQLGEISFNTTEFQSGLDFRFLKSRHPAKIGNGNLWIEPTAARRIRLADIVAASSCFPGGFEPIQYPDDFVWDGTMPGPPSLTPNSAGRLPVGLALMDGGIYDNTGVGALLLAEQRDREAAREGHLEEGRLFDTVVISDVDQRAEFLADAASPAQREFEASFFHFEHEKQPWGLPTWAILWLVRGLAVATGLSMVTIAARLPPTERPSLLWVGLTAGVIAAGPVLLELWLRWRLRGRLSGDVAELWKYLRRQPPAAAVELGALRVKSLLAMASQVFMKRVRQLQVSAAFADPSVHNRLVPNFIYRFLELGQGPHGSTRVAPPPTPEQVNVARTAHAMETNLWFDGKEQLDTVIAAGQNTACFTLLEHIAWRMTVQPSTSLNDLQERLTTLWRDLQENPRRFARPTRQ